MQLTVTLGRQAQVEAGLSNKHQLRSGEPLCRSCGLCCDGTLFGHVNLRSEDDIAALASLGIQILSDRTPPALEQRCAAYKNCSCSIYPDRPQACRTFRCTLLKRFQAELISQAEALKIISEAVTLRDEVKVQIGATFGDDICTFDKFTLRVKDRWKNTPSIEARNDLSKLFEKFAVLWLIVNKHFREEWQR